MTRRHGLVARRRRALVDAVVDLSRRIAGAYELRKSRFSSTEINPAPPDWAEMAPGRRYDYLELRRVPGIKTGALITIDGVPYMITAIEPTLRGTCIMRVEAQA